MADHPIIFSAPMIRALLARKKTQTRRVLKPLPWNAAGDAVDISKAKSVSYVKGADGRLYIQFEHPLGGPLTAHVSRFNVGDRLWCRETWADVNTAVGPGIGYRADSGFMQPEYDGPDYGAGPSYNYDKYPGNYTMWFDDLLAGAPDHGWRSPIHMPRWASRLTLIVESVKVERLQEISDEDAEAEGIFARGAVGDDPSHSQWTWGDSDWRYETPRAAYAALWNSINGPDAWGANPWVAAISFSVRADNIDARPVSPTCEDAP